MKRRLEDTDSHACAEESAFMAASVAKSLRIELRRLRRETCETVIELAASKRRVADMERYVSVVSRAWSQLETDAHVILQSLTGDSTVLEHAHLLEDFLRCTDEVLARDPMSAPRDTFSIDRWSSAEEIERERARLVTAIESKDERAEQEKMVEAVQEYVLDAVAFTKDLLSRLTAQLLSSPALTSDHANAILASLRQARRTDAEYNLLQDAITKLRVELVSTESRYLAKCHQLERLERMVDKGDVHVAIGMGADETSAVESPEELKNRVLLLERQLDGSERAKRDAEAALAEAISAAPSGGSSEETLLHVIGEMRATYKRRVAQFTLEFGQSQSRVVELDEALAAVEVEARGRVDEVAGAAEAELRQLGEERAKALSCVAALQAEVEELSDVRARAAELAELEAAARLSCEGSRDRLRDALAARTAVEDQLTAARRRERALEVALQEGEREVAGLSAAQERADGLEREVQEARASIDDLIAEIEAVAAAEERARTQTSAVLARMEGIGGAQRSLREENLRLLEQVAALQQKHGALKTRLEMTEDVCREGDGIVAASRVAEESMRSALAVEKRTSASLQLRLSLAEDEVAESTLRADQYKAEAASLRSALDLLRARHNAMANELQEERRARMSIEGGGAVKGLSHVESSTLTRDDASMLEMTLSMLRCSICKDRFKNVALTRCYHLFCSECIDETIRNRSRKCPACGDKFGQDDVKSIFFTH